MPDPGPADRYRATWAGRPAGAPPPDVAAFLAGCDPLPPADTADVLRADQHERAGANIPLPAEHYLAAFPAIADDAESVMTLVYGEILDRTDAGDTPTLAEYTARFPQYAEFLSLQWEVHDAIEGVENTDTLTAAGPRTVAGGDGPIVPGYAVEELVGAGRVGVVYRARETRLGRVVALKVVGDGQFARPDVLVRFMEEARVIARLGHPNIVGIHELGRHPSGPYMALEWVGGGTLEDRMKDRPYDAVGAVNLMAVIARAVGHAHQADVVHRDLKPANILMTEAGDPKVADFGLAKHLELGDRGATVTGQPLGTPQYMSPEQARGGKAVTRATDVYSLGAILYEMLTGRAPLVGATVQDTLRLVAEQEPIPPRQLNAKLPKDLATVVMKCLDKDPARRYPAAHDLADDLDRHARGEPVTGRPVGPVTRAARWGRRHRQAAAVAAVVAGLLAVIAVGGVTLAVELAAGRQAHREEASGRAAEAAGRRDEAWRRLLAEARATRAAGRPGRRVDALKLVDDARKVLADGHPGGRLPPADAALLRDEAAAAFTLADAVPAGPDAAFLPGERAVALDPKDRRVTYRSPAGETVVRERASGIALAGGGPAPAAAAPGRLIRFPDDADAAYAVSADAAGVLRVWDRDAGHAIFTAPFDIDPAVPPAFAPTGRTLWYVTTAGRAELLVIHLPDGYEVLARGRATAAPVCAVCPGGRFVAFPTAAGVRVFDRETRQEHAGPAVTSWDNFGFPMPGGGVAALGGDAAPADGGPYRVCLHARGEPVVRLEAADGSRLAAGRVSANNALVVAAGVETRGVHVWDVPKLRTHLAGLGLNWPDSDP